MDIQSQHELIDDEPYDYSIYSDLIADSHKGYITGLGLDPYTATRRDVVVEAHKRMVQENYLYVKSSLEAYTENRTGLEDKAVPLGTILEFSFRERGDDFGNYSTFRFKVVREGYTLVANIAYAFSLSENKHYFEQCLKLLNAFRIEPRLDFSHGWNYLAAEYTVGANIVKSFKIIDQS